MQAKIIKQPIPKRLSETITSFGSIIWDQWCIYFAAENSVKDETIGYSVAEKRNRTRQFNKLLNLIADAGLDKDKVIASLSIYQGFLDQ